MIAAVDYASPSVFESDRERALLGLAASAVRPVRFHGRVLRHIPLLRFTLRALGEAIWSRDNWNPDGDLSSFLLDPVITVHPDRLFFEAFSQDQSVYAMVVIDPGMFATEGDVVTGTTNVDFTAWLWGALNEMRSSRETWLRVGPEGFEVKTRGAGGRFERRVELPDRWVRGFLQASLAMAMPGTRLTVRPADLVAAIRFLRYTKAKVSPRALRYELPPGEEARLVLEPWEQVFRLRGAEHAGLQHRSIRTWGRRRLSLIEGLLPFATSVDIYLKGRGLPSFYAVKMPDLTFVLGLSGWSDQSWTDSGFDSLSDSAVVAPELLTGIAQELARRYHATPKELAGALGLDPGLTTRACERLARQGRAVFDVECRDFRHRELFAAPIDESRLFPPNERRERAAALLADRTVTIATCEPEETRKTKKLKTPDGPVTREVIYRDWRVRGRAGGETAEVVVGDSGRLIFGTCGCPFFQDNLLGRGPCEHLIALFEASTELRRDLPTSVPGSAEAAGGARAAASEEAEPDSEESPGLDSGEEEGDDENR